MLKKWIVICHRGGGGGGQKKKKVFWGEKGKFSFRLAPIIAQPSLSLTFYVIFKERYAGVGGNQPVEQKRPGSKGIAVYYCKTEPAFHDVWKVEKEKTAGKCQEDWKCDVPFNQRIFFPGFLTVQFKFSPRSFHHFRKVYPALKKLFFFYPRGANQKPIFHTPYTYLH